MGKAVIVPGHGLMGEGAAYTVDTRGRVIRLLHNTVGGFGRAACSCGVFSDKLLLSSTARREWHRQHKAEVLESQQ